MGAQFLMSTIVIVKKYLVQSVRQAMLLLKTRGRCERRCVALSVFLTGSLNLLVYNG